MPDLIRQWHVDKIATGTVFSASLFGLMIGSVLFGFIGDRWGRRTAIIVGTVAFGVLTLATGFATSLNEMLAIRFLACVGLGGAVPNAVALTNEYSSKHARVTSIAVIFAGYALGGTLGGVISAQLVPIYGWPVIFYLGGAVSLVLALALLVVKQGSFDAVSECARHLPVSIVSELVGLPEEGRANMLRWAGATFDALGAMNARAEAALPHIEELRAYCSDESTVARLKLDGWAAAIWKAADRGDIPKDKCPAMMRDYISPSLDTTIFAIGSLIWFFGRNPEQWNLVRQDHSLIPAAINEAVRLESPIRGFTRLVVQDTAIDGAELSAGSRLLVLYASANRDERKWDQPDKFDVGRDGRDHLGFGFGAHICAGMHLARLEMTALMTAFARRVSRFDVGEPVRAVNNVLRGFASLPVTVR